MTTWVHSANGRIDHLDNSNDDLIFAFCLALFLRSKAAHSGASFIINEEGDTIEPNSTQKQSLLTYEEELYQEEMVKQANVPDIDTYNWLIGGLK
jgi:hypothetical protein